MSFQDAIAGFQLLQQAFENKNTRTFDLEKLAKQQAYATSERQGTEAFTAGENAKQRAASIEERKIGVGPEYARLKFQKDTQNRILEGNKAAAQTLREGGTAATTPEGTAALQLLESGAISPTEANAMIPDFNTFEGLSKLGQLALVKDDPRAKALHTALTSQALDVMQTKTQFEMMKKLYSGDPSKMQNYKVNASEYKDAIAEAMNDVQGKYGISGYDVRTATEGFTPWLAKQKLDNPSINSGAINIAMTDAIRNVLNSDVNLKDNPNAALLAATKIAEGIGLRGRGAFFNTKTYKLDKEGKQMVENATEPMFYDTGILKDYFFSSREQGRASMNYQKTKAAIALPWTIREQPAPTQEVPVTETKPPQAPPTQPVPTLDASYYLGNVQTKTPVADTAKGLVTP